MGEAKRRRLAGLPPGPRPDDRRTVRALISRIPYPEATSDPVHGRNARIAWDNAGLVAFGLVALEEGDNDGSCALCGRVWKGDDLPAAAVGVVLTGEVEGQTGVRLLCAGCADADQATVMEAIGRPPRRRPLVATRTGEEAERLLRE